MKTPLLSALLKDTQPPLENVDFDAELEKLQHELLRIQQGIWHGKKRVILAFEGFDAAGKGGVIRRITESLDPRGVHVHAIGSPDATEQSKHYLARFWPKLPESGTIAIFDRTWYGRVLVERVEKLIPEKRWQAAFAEINAFEKLLTDDGIDVIKIFLGISKKEQLKRYEERLEDPYKQWKLTEDDIRNRKKWDDYVKATDEMFRKTSTPRARWRLIPADHKPTARHLIFKELIKDLGDYGSWIRTKAANWEHKKLRHELKKLK